MLLILASNNQGKLLEMRRILCDMGIEVISQREADCDFEVEENGDTFEENAWLKAAAVTERTGLPAVADDSGLVVDALNGAPGVHSARYTGRHEDTDEQRNDFLLSNMEGVTDRSARFVSCICCTMGDSTVLRARGECEGVILLEPRGVNGFGYDPLFQPIGYNKTMAELSIDEKNLISHRGKALRKFREELERYYADK